MSERVISIDSVKIELRHDIHYMGDKPELAVHEADSSSFVGCLLYLDHNFLPPLLTTLVPSLCHSPDVSKSTDPPCPPSLLARFKVPSQLPARLKTTKITINLDMPVNIVQRVKKTSNEMGEVLLRGRDS